MWTDIRTDPSGSLFLQPSTWCLSGMQGIRQYSPLRSRPRHSGPRQVFSPRRNRTLEQTQWRLVAEANVPLHEAARGGPHAPLQEPTTAYPANTLAGGRQNGGRTKIFRILGREALQAACARIAQPLPNCGTLSDRKSVV